jgi:uncharacterized cupin superfamily protein
MADNRPAALRAAELPARTATIYPAPFAKALEGRSKRALGDAFGLTQFGVNYTVLEPGSASSERHWHAVEDELVFVLEGEVTLIDEAGEHLLAPGMCAGFKAGVANGHKLVNRGNVRAVFLEIGTRSSTESVVYPDVDMLARKADGKYILTHRDGTPF